MVADEGVNPLRYQVISHFGGVRKGGKGRFVKGGDVGVEPVELFTECTLYTLFDTCVIFIINVYFYLGALLLKIDVFQFVPEQLIVAGTSSFLVLSVTHPKFDLQLSVNPTMVNVEVKYLY
jgi:hypothetical protein